MDRNGQKPAYDIEEILEEARRMKTSAAAKASTAPAASPAPIPAMPEKPAAPVQTPPPARSSRPRLLLEQEEAQGKEEPGKPRRGIFGRKKGREEPDMEEPGYAPAPSRPALAAEDEDDVRVYVPPVKKTVLPASEKEELPPASVKEPVSYTHLTLPTT